MKYTPKKRTNKTVVALTAILAVNVVCTITNLATVKAVKDNNSLKDTEEVIADVQIPETITYMTETTPITTVETEVTTEEIKELKEPEVVVTIPNTTFKDDAEYIEWESAKEDINSDRTLLEIPDYDNTFKSYMSYKCITNTESKQYELQQNAWTDECGLRRYGDAYMVALGTYYADSCGQYFKVKTDNGNEFLVVTGDIKDDSSTNSTNQYVYLSYDKCNIIEFIVDTNTLDSFAKKMGNIDYIDHLSGQIISIEKVEQ